MNGSATVIEEHGDQHTETKEAGNRVELGREGNSAEFWGASWSRKGLGRVLG